MSWAGFFAVGVGGALGCWARWGLGIVLNPLSSSILYGTLAANLIGGYLIGIAVELFLRNDGLPPEWRLFVIVGFLGGLTTFSSFSAEAVNLLRSREIGWTLLLVAVHLLGSLAMTWLGILTMKALHN
jgi:CrcB protein